ncbi:hypothetical protein [Capnocytophaga sp.]|uniref:hypothetical protein n=1 Tax=Capnocytophaga sp. TaxID=44737 RepID=UPI0026DD2B24|nr:hypothetical protein [Capnocytophaga sp.]MDO5106241.1 hypothetical protein [Capnocytophaga sp.]
MQKPTNLEKIRAYALELQQKINQTCSEKERELLTMELYWCQCALNHKKLTMNK